MQCITHSLFVSFYVDLLWFGYCLGCSLWVIVLDFVLLGCLVLILDAGYGWWLVLQDDGGFWRLFGLGLFLVGFSDDCCYLRADCWFGVLLVMFAYFGYGCGLLWAGLRGFGCGFCRLCAALDSAVGCFASFRYFTWWLVALVGFVKLLVGVG